MKLRLLVLPFILGLLVGCDALDNSKPEKLSIEKDFISVTIDSIGYELKVPDYMKPAKDLNEDASLGYQNIFRDVYTVVIDESKEDVQTIFTDLGEFHDSLSMVSNYREIQLGFLTAESAENYRTEPVSSQIGGLDAETIELGMSVDGVEVTYFLTFVEGREKVYMIMTLTSSEKKEKYKETAQQIGESFRLLPERS